MSVGRVGHSLAFRRLIMSFPVLFVYFATFGWQNVLGECTIRKGCKTWRVENLL